MVEVAVIVTISTVVILLALTAITRWIVPKVLTPEEEDDDHPPERPSDGVPPA